MPLRTKLRDQHPQAGWPYRQSLDFERRESLKEELKQIFFCPIQFPQKLDLEDRRTARAIFTGSKVCLNWTAARVFNTSSDDNHPSQKKTIASSSLNWLSLNSTNAINTHLLIRVSQISQQKWSPILTMSWHFPVWPQVWMGHRFFFVLCSINLHLVSQFSVLASY